MDPSDYPPEYLAQDRSFQLVQVIVAFAVLESFFFALFISARLMSKSTNGVDFWLMPAAYLACFSHVIINALSVKYGGAGHHVVTVKPNELIIFGKLIFSEDFLYLLSAMLPKLAILSLYLRIFTQKVYRYIAYAVAVVMVLNWLIGCLMGLLMCKPIAFTWNKTIPGGHCGDIMGAYAWASLPNLVTDVIMLVLPLPAIWKLHTGQSQKVGLTLTFIVGSIGIVTSIVRFRTFFTFNIFADPTWYGVTSQTWTCVEPGVYFIAATLPSLRPLVVASFKRARSSTVYTRYLSSTFRSTSNRDILPSKRSLSDSTHCLDDRSASSNQWQRDGLKSDVKLSEHEEYRNFEMA